MTVTILGSLKIGKEGRTALEFVPQGLLLRFLGDSDMGQNVIPTQNEIISLPHREITISAMNDQSVCIQCLRIYITEIKNFEVQHKGP